MLYRTDLFSTFTLLSHKFRSSLPTLYHNVYTNMDKHAGRERVKLIQFSHLFSSCSKDFPLFPIFYYFADHVFTVSFASLGFMGASVAMSVLNPKGRTTETIQLLRPKTATLCNLFILNDDEKYKLQDSLSFTKLKAFHLAQSQPSGVDANLVLKDKIQGNLFS